MTERTDNISLPRAILDSVRYQKRIAEGKLTASEIEAITEANVRVVKASSPNIVEGLLKAKALYDRLRSLEKEHPLVMSPETQTTLVAAYTVIHKLSPPVLTNLIRSRLEMESHGDPSKARKSRKRKYEKELGIKIPWSLVIDVTSNCNIHPPCKGCHAAEYPHSEGPSLAKLNKLVGEAQELGISNIVFSGGEPLTREADLLQVMSEHPYLNYSIFSNGTLIGEGTAERFLSTGAVTAIFIHIEGGRETTDKFMGKGNYERITRGMQHLKNCAFPFGFGITVSTENFNEVTSQEFLDDLRQRGCSFGIFFPYVPTGRHPKPELMLNSEQRDKLAKVSQQANKSGLLVISPEEYYRRDAGCSAGLYASVTVDGRIQPCVFIHHASDEPSVYDTSLEEALRGSELIAACQAETRKDKSSCLIRDRKGHLTQIIEDTGAISTEK